MQYLKLLTFKFLFEYNNFKLAIKIQGNFQVKFVKTKLHVFSLIRLHDREILSLTLGIKFSVEVALITPVLARRALYQ